jgi:hypothetical protein
MTAIRPPCSPASRFAGPTSTPCHRTTSREHLPTPCDIIGLIALRPGGSSSIMRLAEVGEDRNHAQGPCRHTRVRPFEVSPYVIWDDLLPSPALSSNKCIILASPGSLIVEALSFRSFTDRISGAIRIDTRSATGVDLPASGRRVDILGHGSRQGHVLMHDVCMMTGLHYRMLDGLRPL